MQLEIVGVALTKTKIKFMLQLFLASENEL